MWLFTSKSFISIVADKDDPTRRLLRSRCPGDIEELFPDANVFEDTNADYRYRAFVSAGDVKTRIGQYIEEIDYPNFKNSIPMYKRAYLYACTGVWSIMLGLQKAAKK
jgi:hypothetical protein